MRWLLAALIALAGCGNDAASEASDAGSKSCAATSCVEGASCVTRAGVTCTCIATGVWSCGSVARPSGDGGLDFDIGGIPSDPGDALIEPDSIPSGDSSRDIPGCGTIDVCVGEDPVEGARAELHNLMLKCGAYCTVLTLTIQSDGCPIQFTASHEWTPGALDCIEKSLTTVRIPCTTRLMVTTSACPK